ncbi:prostacyclin receptor-like [Antedon mediterranea]|uniref:prostacyclin receptor-like n=1 Tax=Antedon mediterranea TaxID=105859 RepID=UPI003AF93070
MTTALPDSIHRPPFDEEGASFNIFNNMNRDSNINMTEMVALQPSVKVRTPILMCTLGVTGNIIAICLYHTSDKIYRRFMFYRLFLGLFWTNILGYVTSYPLMLMAFEAGLNWKGATATCKFHGFSMLSFGLACSYITGTISMERFLSICRPITHAYKMERRKAPWTIGLLWIMSGFGAMLPLMGFGGVQLMYPNTWCFLNWRNEETVAKLYACVAASMIIGVVGLVGGCASLCTLVLIHFRLKPPQRRPYPVDEKDVTGKVRLKIQLERKFEVWMLVQFDLLAGAFVMCFLPIGMRIIANTTGQPVDNSKDLYALNIVLAFPVAVPYMYIFFHRQFLSCFCSPCKRVCCPKRRDLETTAERTIYGPSMEFPMDSLERSLPNCNSQIVSVNSVRRNGRIMTGSNDLTRYKTDKTWVHTRVHDPKLWTSHDQNGDNMDKLSSISDGERLGSSEDDCMSIQEIQTRMDAPERFVPLRARNYRSPIIPLSKPPFLTTATIRTTGHSVPYSTDHLVPYSTDHSMPYSRSDPWKPKMPRPVTSYEMYNIMLEHEQSIAQEHGYSAPILSHLSTEMNCNTNPGLDYHETDQYSSNDSFSADTTDFLEPLFPPIGKQISNNNVSCSRHEVICKIESAL